MARNIVFTHDPESCSSLAGNHLLGRNVVPFSERLREFKKEKKLNPRVEWGRFIGYFEEDSNRNDAWKFRHLREMRRPLLSWVLSFIERVETGVRMRVDDTDFLSWTFSYYLHRSETEEAIRFSTPAWFVKVTDPENQIVHPNWTVMLDYEGDFTIKRGVATNDDPMSKDSLVFWENAEGRLLDAMYSHLHLRELKRRRTK